MSAACGDVLGIYLDKCCFHYTMKQIDILDDIYEDALKIAKERNESVQAVIEELIREKVTKRPAPRSIMGLFLMSLKSWIR